MTSPPLLAPGDIHLWQAPLTAAAGELASLERLVSGEERSRADAFRFVADRERFLAARGGLRRLLAGYLGADPARLRLAAETHGQPYVAGGAAGDLMFNLSHSGDMVLYAITRGRHVGVDIEKIHHDLDIDGLAARLYTPAERATLDRLSGDDRTVAFLTLWTRKEAILKAVGTGLTVAPHLIEAIPGHVVRVSAPELPTAWSVGGVVTAPGYCAAVAVTPPGARLPRRARRLP